MNLDSKMLFFYFNYIHSRIIIYFLSIFLLYSHEHINLLGHTPCASSSSLGYTRAAIRPLHQHLPVAGSTTRHRHDAETRLRRQHLRNCQILSAQQQRPVPSRLDDGAASIRAVPGGPLSGHVVRRGGHNGGRVVWRK